MTLTYRATTANYTGKGSRLTIEEGDENLWECVSRLLALEGVSLGKGIDEITIAGDLLTITYTNSSFDTVTFPTAAFEFRGDWLPSTLYAATDLFLSNGTLYQVLLPHTSASEFDPAANNGTGSDYYIKIMSSLAIPGFEISDTVFTPTFAHQNGYIRLTSASTSASYCDVIIDPATPFDSWAELTFRDETEDGANFGISTPGSINSQFGCNNVSAGKGSTVTLKRVADTTEWDIMGDLMQSTV